MSESYIFKEKQKPKNNKLKPSFEIENSFNGLNVVGMDEAGCGPWAGPIVSACAFIKNKDDELLISKINDSKKISKINRKSIYEKIIKSPSIITSVGISDNNIIDSMGFSFALNKSMVDAFNNICKNELKFHVAIVDGIRKPKLENCDIHCIKKGDEKSFSIACASIIAKVTRDLIMEKLHDKFPFYGWNTNSGYGTKKHIESLKEYGSTKYHRMSFKPLKEFK